MLPAPIPSDEPTAVDLFLARPSPHLATLAACVLAGLFVNSPALALGGAVLVVLYSNFFLRRRLLRLYRDGAYRRFLAMADRIQQGFPLPFRPLTNLPELRAIARVKIGDTELGKQIFRAYTPPALPPASASISTYNMAVMFLEMQDPASALEILDGLDGSATHMGDLFPMMRGAQLTAHFLRGELDRAATRLAEARAASPPPAAAASLDSWGAMLTCERDGDPAAALVASQSALSRADQADSAQTQDCLAVNHVYIAVRAGTPPLEVLDQVVALAPAAARMTPYQRGLLHYVAAACHAQTGQVADASRDLDAAETECRSTWLTQRCAELRTSLASGEAVDNPRG